MRCNSTDSQCRTPNCSYHKHHTAVVWCYWQLTHRCVQCYACNATCICVCYQFAEASRLKEDGTLLFKEKRFEEAAACYEEATTYIEKKANSDDADNDDDMISSSSDSSSSSSTVATPAAINALLLSCHLNAAQAYLNAHDWLSAVTAANEALGVDANNVKGLYRRAVARYIHTYIHTHLLLQ
jgi:tetratricopeptide (TPR) repeat protein